MFDLSGRKALVTGATGGLGGAIARSLHAQGAHVAISGTRREALEALAGELGERVHVLEANLSDTAAVEALVPAAEAALGGLDVLVNNAGITRDNLFLRMKDEEWDSVDRREPDGGVPAVAGGGEGDDEAPPRRIVNIGSGVGATGNAGQGNYAAAKAGLVGLTKALAAEVASRKITVNCIAPGFITSPMTDVLNDKQREGILATVPMGRLARAPRSRPPRSISPRTRRPTSPARRCTSTAAWRCTDPGADGGLSPGQGHHSVGGVRFLNRS